MRARLAGWTVGWRAPMAMILGLAGLTCFALALAAPGTSGTGGAVAEARHALFVFPGGVALEVHVFVDTGVADPDEVMAAIVAGMPVPAVEEGEGVGAAFGILYKWAPQDIPVEVWYWDGADPGGIPGETVAEWGMGVWNAVPHHNFAFDYMGTTAVQPPDCTNLPPGSPPPADGENGTGFAPLGAGILGVTCGYYSLLHQVDGHPRIFEFDILLNSVGIPWSAAAGVTPPGTYDVYSTMLHELGHALGLAHSSSPNVMAPTLGTGQQRRVPQADDINGVWELYGTGMPATETPAPTSTSTATAGPTPTPTSPPTATATSTAVPFRMTMPGMTRE